MFKDKKKPRNKISKRNNACENGSTRRKNIFELIEPLRKEIHIETKSIKNKFAFAENLIAFLTEKQPLELQWMSFDESQDDINTLVNALIKVVIDSNYQIMFDEGEEDNIAILYEIWEMEFMWYLLEFSWIDCIESEEMKIGYTHLLAHLSNVAYIDAFEGDYNNIDDNPFSSEFSMNLDEYYYTDDEDEIDEGMYQERVDNTEEELKELREWKGKFIDYSNKSFNDFKNYIPKNEEESAFKNHILKGFELNLDLIRRFVPDTSTEEGGYSFDQAILLYFNASSGVEEMNFEMINEDASNSGGYNPCGWYSIKEGVVENETPQEDIDGLYDIYQFIIDLFDNHLTKIKK